MELIKAKEEFIETISNSFKINTATVKAITKKDDDPTTVGGLINWFLTCKTTELKPISVAKWSVKRAGSVGDDLVFTPSNNYELVCGNHQFITSSTLFIRPLSHNIIIGNSDILSKRNQYGLSDVITDNILEKVTYMLSFGHITKTYNTAWIKVIQTCDDSLLFTVGDSNLLFTRYNELIPDGVTFKLSTDKLVMNKAYKEVWPNSLAISDMARPCYIIPTTAKVVVTKSEAEEYHYNSLIKIIDTVGKLDVAARNNPIVDAKKYNLPVKKLPSDVSYTIKQKMNSLKCMVDPKYGSCRFTNITSNFELKLSDGIGKEYMVTTTAGVATFDKIYVRGCISICETRTPMVLPSVFSDKWVELIIPVGIKTLNETNKKEEN